MPLPEEFGGGGFPRMIGLIIQELMTSANMAFALCPLLTQGAIEALVNYGDPGPAAALPAEDGHRRVGGHDESHRAAGRARMSAR